MRCREDGNPMVYNVGTNWGCTQHRASRDGAEEIPDHQDGPGKSNVSLQSGAKSGALLAETHSLDPQLQLLDKNAGRH